MSLSLSLSIRRRIVRKMDSTKSFIDQRRSNVEIKRHVRGKAAATLTLPIFVHGLRIKYDVNSRVHSPHFRHNRLR